MQRAGDLASTPRKLKIEFDESLFPRFPTPDSRLPTPYFQRKYTTLAPLQMAV